jgi:hypothetical protein
MRRQIFAASRARPIGLEPEAWLGLTRQTGQITAVIQFKKFPLPPGFIRKAAE